MGSHANGKKLEAVKQKYAEWLRYPSTEARVAAGLPRTRQDFVDHYNINRTTIWRWENDPDFKREVVNPLFGMVQMDDLVLIITAQVNKAKEGNTQAARFVMDVLGITGKNMASTKQPREPKQDDFADMSEAQLEQYLAQFTEGDIANG